MIKKFRKVLSIAAVVGLLAGCSSSTTSPEPAQEPASQPQLTGDALVEAAKKEGEIVSYGMPDNWANYGEMWVNFTAKYGLKHTDTDMSSAEELAKFIAEKDNPVADVGDIGFSFGQKGKEQGAYLAHKNPYWDEIPDWAKDPDGHYAAVYTGTMAFIVNTKLVPSVPKTWNDLLKPEYKNSVVTDDVAKAAQGNYTPLATAIALGGDEKNIQPGIDFWAKVAQAGNLKLTQPTLNNIQKGEVPIAIIWDFNALAYKDQLNMPELEVVIPVDGSVTAAYLNVINKWSPHPNAARLLNDYLFSDEGQISIAKGYARPIRESVKFPEEIAKKMLPSEMYKNAKPVTDNAAWENTVKELPKLWQEQVLIHATQ